MFEKLEKAWKRDPLAVLGVGSAVVAFLLWAVPTPVFCVGTAAGSRWQCGQEYFQKIACLSLLRSLHCHSSCFCCVAASREYLYSR